MDADAKQRLLRTIPYGLYAACTKPPEGGHHAFLLSWVTQASFEPPLVVCCVHTESRAYEHLSSEEGRPIAINLFGEGQKELAAEILKKPAFEDGVVAGTPYKEGATGCALLTETLGALEARVVDEAGGGDHAVFVCEVEDAHSFREGEPLTHENTGWKYGG